MAPFKVFAFGLYYATFLVFKLYSCKYISIIKYLSVNRQNDMLVEEPH